MSTTLTEIFTLPVAVLGVGNPQTFTSPEVGGVYNRWRLTFTQGVSWPSSGQVLQVDVYRSTDGGATYQHCAGCDVGPGTWLAGATTGSLDCGTDPSVGPTAATDLFRIIITALQTVAAPTVVLYGYNA